MADDKMKNAEQLNLDDLDNVNGGSGLTDFAASLLGFGKKTASANKTIRTAGNIADAAPGKTMDADAGAGINKTITAFCPVCGKDTEFQVFSGARARCNACGSFRLDM